MPERARDDPWDALKRLLRRNSTKPVDDTFAVLSGVGLLAKGAGMKALASNSTPTGLKDFIVDAAIRFRPNLVAEEFQSRGLPHKLTGVWIDAIAEQRPDPNSRVSLADRTDRIGVPLAKVDWRINADERRTIVRIAQLTRDTFERVGIAISDPRAVGRRRAFGRRRYHRYGPYSRHDTHVGHSKVRGGRSKLRGPWCPRAVPRRRIGLPD